MTSKLASVGEPRGRGRPKAFDRAFAVQAAMRLFWECGYEGASFDDLAATMGINPSSFRNTFKSKEALYREASEAYVAEATAWFAGVLSDEKDVRSAFLRLFTETAERYTRSELPSGCMISLAGTHLPQRFSSLSEMMTGYRASAEEMMVVRLKQGKDESQLPADANVHVLAAFFNALLRGMAVQARDGAMRERLAEIATVAMNAFPSMPARVANT